MTQFDPRLLDEEVEDLYEHAPCGYLSMLPDGTILKVNETLLAWLGYERTALVGRMRFQELLSIGGRIYYETHFAPLLNMQGFVHEIAFDLMKKDRELLPVYASTIQRRKDSGAASVNRMTLFNVTDRRQYERELLLERQRAEAAARANADLARELQADIAARRHTEAQLQAQADLSQFAAGIASHLIEQSDVGNMLRGCVRAISHDLSAAHVAIWTVREHDRMLELQVSSGGYSDVAEAYAVIPLDRLKIGRIVRDRQPEYTNEVAGHPLLPEDEWPRREGIVAFAGYPLIIEHRAIGLMAIFFRRELSGMVIQALSAAANHIALGIERILANVALRQSEARFRSLAEHLEQRVEQRTLELVESQRSLRVLTTELNLAEQRERKRLATELHDHLQQLLVLGKIRLGQGKRMALSPSAAGVIQQVDELLTEALAYTRTLVTELSPPVLRDQGLGAGLQWLAEYMKKHDLRVTVTLPEEDGLALPEEHVVLLFQSVRELLINSAKHAGTGEATVRMERQGSALTIEVSDQGKGFQVAEAETPKQFSSKFGLFSIQERMHALGGSFTLQSSEHGTRCLLVLPLR